MWPRFHLSVVETLSSCSPEVIELHVDMTPSMRTIQSSVLDLINFSLSELRRLNPNLLVDDLTVENAISRWNQVVRKGAYFQLNGLILNVRITPYT